jgi:hypothetical protein
VSYLKVFGSVAYVHILDQRRVKLDDKSLKLIFIGYDEMSKAYKLFDPSNKKIHISRHIQVNEEVIWDWSAMKETFHENAPEMHSPVNISPNNHEEVPPTTHNASSSDDEARPLKIRSIRGLYEATSELHSVCLLAQGDNIPFEEAVVDDKWQAAIDDEMHAIVKNDTWEK